MRLVRAEMLEVLRTDYIKFARARGLERTAAINFGHALKNTLVPVITIIGLQIGALIAFSIITETVFQWPGMGLLIIQAIQFVDIPIMSSYLVLIALFFVADQPRGRPALLRRRSAAAGRATGRGAMRAERLDARLARATPGLGARLSTAGSGSSTATSGTASSARRSRSSPSS